eukprot:g1886.t1
MVQHGKVVLTPAEVVRYKFVAPPKAEDVGDPSDEGTSGDDWSEEDAIQDLVELGVPRADAEARLEAYKKNDSPLILRGTRPNLGTHFEEWDDDPARDGEIEELRAKDREVDRQLRWYEKLAQEQYGFCLIRHHARAAVGDDGGSNSSGASTSSETVPILKRDFFYWLFFDHTEAEAIYFLEQLEAIDEILPSDGIMPATDTGWITTAAPVGRLPAMVSDQPVDWRPKVRATVAIPFADYPVAPPAAQGRHWITAFNKPLVTGREAETGKPIVQFLRTVNTRASRKTELLRLLLHNARAVLSKSEFERILDLEHKPYLKWFLTVKHPRGAPGEYLQELQDLDDWRNGCVWACGLGAVLLALLGLAGGAKDVGSAKKSGGGVDVQGSDWFHIRAWECSGTIDGRRRNSNLWAARAEY